MRHDRSGTNRSFRARRVNELLREILAEEITELSVSDDRFIWLTITGVKSSPDLSKATVWFDRLTPESAEALAENRRRIQSALSKQVHMKRTPVLEFAEDPSIVAGERIDEILKKVKPSGDEF